MNEVTRDGKHGNTITITKKVIIVTIEISATNPIITAELRKIDPGKNWEQKEKDSKITLLCESSHFILAKFSDSFFTQFDLAMKLRREELKKQGKVDTEVSGITKEDLVEAFGITKDQMTKAGRNTRQE